MKIQNIFIGVLFLLLGYSGYQNIVFIDEQKKDSKNLIKRIIKAETNIDNMIDHINNDAVDMLEIEKNLLLEIENLNGRITEHEHEVIEIEKEIFKPTIPVQPVESTEPVEPVETLERTYNEATGLHVPVFVEQVPEARISTASCPRPHNNLLPYINNIDLRRNYQFRVNYNVKDNEIVDINYSRSLPSKLKGAINNYLNSFETTGDVTGCYVPIKLLRS